MTGQGEVKSLHEVESVTIPSLNRVVSDAIAVAIETKKETPLSM